MKLSIKFNHLHIADVKVHGESPPPTKDYFSQILHLTEYFNTNIIGQFIQS